MKNWKTGDNTPWGAVQSVDKVNEQIAFVSTAGHGGYMVPAAIAQERIPAAVLSALFAGYFGGFYAFEEDCDAALLFLFMPELLEGGKPRLERLKGSVLGMAQHNCWTAEARKEITEAATRL